MRRAPAKRSGQHSLGQIEDGADGVANLRAIAHRNGQTLQCRLL